MQPDKRACIERARKFLETPSPENLRYAALELRMCMEALTYEKLHFFSGAIPESVLSKWQPPQAVKAILEFEPMADRSFVIHAGVEEEYGKPAKNMQFVGQHKSLRLQWLRKHYNKVGNILHFPSTSTSVFLSASRVKEYLDDVIADVEEALSGNILGGTLREVYVFECSECKSQVVCNKQTVAKTKKAICFNPQCGAEYFAEISEDGNSGFRLMVTEFDCTNCGALISVENRKLDIGMEFQCGSCNTRHRIVSRQWCYGAIEA